MEIHTLNLTDIYMYILLTLLTTLFVVIFVTEWKLKSYVVLINYFFCFVLLVSFLFHGCLHCSLMG